MAEYQTDTTQTRHYINQDKQETTRTNTDKIGHNPDQTLYHIDKQERKNRQTQIKLDTTQTRHYIT